VNKAETERALAKPPAAWLAYDHYLRAAHTFLRFHSSFDKEDLLQVRRSLEQALAIDPDYARAHALLSKSYIELCLHRWDDAGPCKPPSTAPISRLARRCGSPPICPAPTSRSAGH